MILDICHSSNAIVLEVPLEYHVNAFIKIQYWHLILSLYYGTATVGLCEDMSLLQNDYQMYLPQRSS